MQNNKAYYGEGAFQAMTRVYRKLTSGYYTDGRKAVIKELEVEADIAYCIYDEDLDALSECVLVQLPKGAIPDDTVVNATEIQPDLVAELQEIEEGSRFFYIDSDKLTLANFGPITSKSFK